MCVCVCVCVYVCLCICVIVRLFGRISYLACLQVFDFGCGCGVFVLCVASYFHNNEMKFETVRLV